VLLFISFSSCLSGIRNIEAGFSPRAWQPSVRRNIGTGDSARTFWHSSYSTHALRGQTANLFLACHLYPFFREALVILKILPQLPDITSRGGGNRSIRRLCPEFGFS